MSFTRPWDENQPLGSADPRTLDTILHNLKVDLRERLNVLFQYFGSDPLLPRLEPMHWSEGAIVTPTTFAVANGYIAPNAVSTLASLRMPVRLPVGLTVSSIQFTCFKSAGATVALDFRKILTDGTDSSIVSGNVTSTDWAVTTLNPGSAEVIADDTFYYCIISLTSDGSSGPSARFAGMKVVLA